MSGIRGRVSVLMPARDEERWIADAVQSALSQSHRDLEVIVADGGSRDRTREIVSGFAAHDPRVLLVDNPDQLIPSGLNAALARASGEFVARIDAHARVSPDYLERAVAALRRDPSLAAVGGRRVPVADTAVGRAIGIALSSPVGVGDSINHYASEAQRTDHASFGVYRADDVRAAGGWDEHLVANEDVDLDLHLLRAGHGIWYDPAMLIHWHTQPTLPTLARQYRRYGRAKAAMARKNGFGAMRPRHLAPPGIALALGTAATLAGIGRPRAAAAVAVPYAVGVTAAGVVLALQRRDQRPSVVALPAALATLHLAWGCGFVEGLAGLRAADASRASGRGRWSGRAHVRG